MTGFSQLRTIVAAVACIGMASATHAQTYPGKNIHLLVGYAPGGTGDIVARC